MSAAFDRATGYGQREWLIRRLPNRCGKGRIPHAVAEELKSRGWRWHLVDPHNHDRPWDMANDQARATGLWFMRLPQGREDEEAVAYAKRMALIRTTKGDPVYEVRSRELRRK